MTSLSFRRVCKVNELAQILTYSFSGFDIHISIRDPMNLYPKQSPTKLQIFIGVVFVIALHDYLIFVKTPWLRTGDLIDIRDINENKWNLLFPQFANLEATLRLP